MQLMKFEFLSHVLKFNDEILLGSNTPRKTNRKQMSTKANNSRSDQDKKSTLNIEPQESSTVS